MSGDEEDNRPLLEVARQLGIIPDLSILDEAIQMGPPPRPKRHRFPSDIDSRLAAARAQLMRVETTMTMKDDNKCVSLGTSKVNYIDPRIVCAWAHREEVPITKIFNKSLIKKFPWAEGIEDNFEF